MDSSELIPRRIDLRRNIPAELAIRNAIHAVEELAAEVRLTDAVVLLGAALQSVGDYVDKPLVTIRRSVTEHAE